MEIKVRELTDVQEKSVQEVEQELLDKHEAQQEIKFEESNPETKTDQSTDKKVEEKPEEEKPTEPQAKEDVSEPVEEKIISSELKEEDVLSFIGERYGKKINSIDELVTAREEAPQMPEDIAAYFKYKKETGEVLKIL